MTFNTFTFNEKHEARNVNAKKYKMIKNKGSKIRKESYKRINNKRRLQEKTTITKDAYKLKRKRRKR